MEIEKFIEHKKNIFTKKYTVKPNTVFLSKETYITLNNRYKAMFPGTHIIMYGDMNIIVMNNPDIKAEVGIFNLKGGTVQ